MKNVVEITSLKTIVDLRCNFEKMDSLVNIFNNNDTIPHLIRHLF